MSSVTHVVVPTQFSGPCEQTLCCAAAFATRFDADISVLHVLEPLTHLAFDTDRTLREVERHRNEWAEREMQRLRWSIPRTLRVQTACVEGDPAGEIVRYADRLPADMIFMATHGHGPVRRFLLGSVTAKVLHDAACPVWTDAHLSSEGTPRDSACEIGQILCGVDFGDHSETAAQWSDAIARRWGAKLSLVHVLAPGQHGKEAHRECESARAQMEALQRKLETPTTVHLLRGDVAAELATTVSALRADLLVIGRGQLKGGGRLRSHSYEILRESVCPVVSV